LSTTQIKDVDRRLATLTDEDSAGIAIEAGWALYLALVEAGVTSSHSLHSRVGRSVNREFVQDDEGAYSMAGEEFAANTGATGKAGTAAAELVNSDAAFRKYGEELPTGPSRWTGGVVDDSPLKFKKEEELPSDNPANIIWGDQDPSVAANSGDFGEIDRAVSAGMASTHHSLRALRPAARLRIEAALGYKVDWAKVETATDDELAAAAIYSTPNPAAAKLIAGDVAS